MVGSSALMGISLFLFATVNTEASNIGLNAMVRTICIIRLPYGSKIRGAKYVQGAPLTFGPCEFTRPLAPM